MPKEITTGEPEELISQALYLLQLCQQDLNIERTTLIAIRAKRAGEACQQLAAIFSPT